MAEFFNMGGYGVYIWPCYGLSALMLGILIIRRRKHLLRLRRDDARNKA